MSLDAKAAWQFLTLGALVCFGWRGVALVAFGYVIHRLIIRHDERVAHDLWLRQREIDALFAEEDEMDDYR